MSSSSFVSRKILFTHETLNESISVSEKLPKQMYHHKSSNDLVFIERHEWLSVTQQVYMATPADISPLIGNLFNPVLYIHGFSFHY